MLFSTAPFFGALFSSVGLGETLNASQVAAGAILIVSLALLAGERHEHSHAHEAAEHSHSHRHWPDLHHRH